MPVRLRLAAASLVLLLTGPPGPARAATWHVPGDVPTLAAALDSAQSGDTVLLACGMWVAQGLTLRSGVTVRGAAGDPACVTVDGGGTARLFDCAGASGVRLEALTLANGLAVGGSFFDQAGGALRFDSAEVTLENCVIRNNRAAFGAGIAARSSVLTITGCRFEADSARSATGWAAGGAMWVKRCTGTISSCVFERNAAFGASPPGDGGAIFSEEGTLVFADCTFTSNAAGVGAGAFYSYLQDRSSILRCTFTGNRAPAGGAIYVENSYPFVDESAFAANAAHNGGALFLGGGRPTLRGCVFEGDTASPFAGGAIDCWQATPLILSCTFRGTSTAARGGAIAAHGNSRFTLEDCLIEGTAAAAGGGAVFVEGTALGTLRRCTIRGTSTGGGGAAVSATASSSVVLDASIVAFSVAGAAASCSGSSSITATCTDVFGNAGGDWTGCLAPQAGASGNFSLDPLFCASATDGSLTLPDSPCLATNSPCGVRVGAAAGGCGCPTGATVLVPADFPTIAVALAAASPGDVVGVCSGEWEGGIDVVSGVHVVGVRTDLARIVPAPASPGVAVLRAAHVSDSTVVADLALDGRGLVPQVVLAESLSTGLRLARTVVTGGAAWGVVNGPDSRLVIGGSLAAACDVFGNGGAVSRSVRNDNVAADSLVATHVFWGTQAYDEILASVQGKVRTCPITNQAHDAALCAPLSALAAPEPPAARAAFLAVAPNPARGEAAIAFAAPPGRRVTVRVHDVAGRRGATRPDGPLPTGGGEVRWNTRDARGRPVAPGVYFVRLEGAETSATRRLVILR